MASALVSALVLATGTAHAANHALIMWISDYDDAAFGNPPPDRSPDLPGVALDAESAKRIARAIGVLPENVKEYRNSQLTLDGMQRAMAAFAETVQPGDKAFVYYAGHGTQKSGASGGPCREGLMTYDAKVLWQAQFSAAVERIAARAAQVVVLNDSCFAGGIASASSRSARTSSGVALRARNYPYAASFTPVSNDAEGYVCGVPLNSARARDAGRSSSRVVYVASAAATEVAWESSAGGGIGTSAWLQCVSSAAAGSAGGSLSASQLQACAQAKMDPSFRDEPQKRQRVSLFGNDQLSIVLGDTANPSGNPTAAIAAGGLLNLYEKRDQNIDVSLRLSSNSLRIGVGPNDGDLLQFNVRSSISGFLYLLHITPDGQNFTVLFPNARDENNQLVAGRDYRFPGSNWVLRSRGPEGTGYLIALVSATAKDFSRSMSRSGPFSVVAVNRPSAQRLAVEAGMSYGTSEVVPVIERR